MSEIKGDPILRDVLTSLQSRFQLSDAYLSLLRKDLEDLADQGKEEQQRTIRQVEEEIRTSVSTAHHHSHPLRCSPPPSNHTHSNPHPLYLVLWLRAGV